MFYFSSIQTLLRFNPKPTQDLSEENVRSAEMSNLTIFGQVQLQFNSKVTQVQSKWDGTWIALELVGHAFGFNLN